MPLQAEAESCSSSRRIPAKQIKRRQTPIWLHFTWVVTLRHVNAGIEEDNKRVLAYSSKYRAGRQRSRVQRSHASINQEEAATTSDHNLLPGYFSTANTIRCPGNVNCQVTVYGWRCLGEDNPCLLSSFPMSVTGNRVAGTWLQITCLTHTALWSQGQLECQSSHLRGKTRALVTAHYLWLT